jgi:hypothetical protein
MVNDIIAQTGSLSKHLLALRKRHPQIVRGVQKMFDHWKAYFGEPKEGKWSMQFKYGRSCVAFRIESPLRPDGIPRIVVYPGDKDNKRGSPLLKGISRKAKEDFSRRFGIEPRPGKKNGDWEKILTEDIPPVFYVEFIEYALARVKHKVGK